MNALIKGLATEENKTTTKNGSPALKSSTNPIVDMFYGVGSCQDQQRIVELFEKAYHEDQDLAIRVMLYVRDIRGGMGMRQAFRTILTHMANKMPKVAMNLIPLVPKFGRWDDLYALFGTPLEQHAVFYWGYHLTKGDKLASKWAPRVKSSNKDKAKKITKMLGLTPKEYRKLVAGNTEVVETLMSDHKWDDINFNTIPSVASARYQKAFMTRVEDRYTKYRDALINGEKGTKINAGAIFPHTVISACKHGEESIAEAQWKSLPDYMKDCKYNILPMVDVSGSMGVDISGNTTALEVAIALGIYTSERTAGEFKDKFITFDSTPTFVDLSGLSLATKVTRMDNSPWGMSTNFNKAFHMILDVAVANNVPQTDMPEIMIVFSDMQFDRAEAGYRGYAQSATPSTNHEQLKLSYESAGYVKPIIVYWNLAGDPTVPVTSDEFGTIMISGFSPAVMSAVLSMNLDDISPISLVKHAVCGERYDWSVTNVA